MDPVAADHCRPPRRRQRSAGAGVDEASHRAAGVGVDSGAAVPGQHPPGAVGHPVEVGPLEHLLQVAPVDLELGPLVTGVAADRLGVHELAEPVEEARLPGGHGHVAQSVGEPQQAELLAGVGQKADPHPDGLDLGRRLIDTGADAPFVQHQGQREPADAAPDDDHIIHGGPAGTIGPAVRPVRPSRPDRTPASRRARPPTGCGGSAPPCPSAARCARGRGSR